MALTVIEIKKAPDGKLFDGGGLTLIKSGTKGKWVYRYSHLGKRREMGLGSWPAVGLAEARRSRDTWMAVLLAGKDPIEERRKAQTDARSQRDREDPTFAQMVDIVFEAIKPTLRGGGARGRWRSPLDLYVIPAIGGKRMSEVLPIDIREAISPIWRTKHPTAIKAVNRTRMVFRDARLMGYACDPFTVEAGVHSLGKHVHVATPITATPWAEMPALWQRLDPSTTSARCLRWLMLTLVRADAGRGARVSEVTGDVWTVPSDRVKGTEQKVTDFRVPLSSPARAMVKECRHLGVDLMFPGQRGVTAIGDRAIEKHLDNLGEAGRPHGFRTAFKTWVQDTDSCSWEVSETILGHTIGSRVERSYARSDLLERRAAAMEAWAAFLTGETAADVIPIRR